MTLRVSTGLRNAMMVTGSLKSQLDGGHINIYSGTPPTDADSSIGASTILCTITLNGTATGLTIDTIATNGSCTKANEVWSGTNILSGTATYWRFVQAGDTGGASTSEKRLQGLASTSGSELVMTTTALVAAAPQNVDYFSVGLPA